MRLYRLLLRLYPPRFSRPLRARSCMAAFDAGAPRAALRRPRRRASLFWFHIVRDLLRSAGTAARAPGLPLAHLSGPRGTRLPQPVKEDRDGHDAAGLRYALRQFVRRPGFTAVAVLSLALAIGGNSLIYGLVDGFVLHPFPYPDPDRLVSVGVNFPKLSSETTYVEALSPAEYADIRASRTFASTAAFDLGNRNISGGDVPERVFTALLLDDLVSGPRHEAGARSRVHARGARRRTDRGSRSSATGSGRPASAAIRESSTGRSASAASQRRSSASCRAGLVLIGTDLWIPWGGDPDDDAAEHPAVHDPRASGAGRRRLPQANAELAAIARPRRSERSARSSRSTKAGG